jgi:membrane-bound serine protease (ClpP class)
MTAMARMQRLLMMLGLLGLVWLGLGGAATAAPATAAQGADQVPVGPGSNEVPAVQVLEVGGVLDGSLLGSLRGAVAKAERERADVLLLQLDGFGGLGVDPGEVRRVVEEAKVPIAVWVGPRQATAQGAATLLVAGADVVGVSRDAVIGPALPAELGRRAGDPAAEGVVRSAGLPESVLRGTVGGAAARGAGIADYEAESLPDAIQRLDGVVVDGRPLAIGETWRLTFQSKSIVDRVRHGLANPALAYLLILAAACCLAFEWFQPGFGVAGIAGVVVALLAVYSLVVLPTSWLALAALCGGLLLFTVDTAAGGLGLGTLTATALTAVGSFWLFNSPSELLRLNPWLAAAGVLWCLVYYVVILTVVLRSQRAVPEGGEALVGSRGVVRSMLNPGGIVVVDGAIWRANLTADGLLESGQRVTVAAVEGGVLQVTPDDPTAVRPNKKRRLRSASTIALAGSANAGTAQTDTPSDNGGPTP